MQLCHVTTYLIEYDSEKKVITKYEVEKDSVYFSNFLDSSKNDSQSSKPEIFLF